jgi:tetratricopeptide (TPR) repeat protein
MTWRARPVFVSGTFRDMHEERDAIASQVFPALEERLLSLRTHLERVDLRVGVETRGLADDHAKQELVLKVCLEDVRRCRPFLIVLVGDRYGWVPPRARAEAAAREARFETMLDGKSVTALETEFGLWGDPEQITRSRIYFRELDDSAMDEADAILYSDTRAARSSLVSVEERRLATERSRNLRVLRDKLRSDPMLGPRCRNYKAGWDPVRRRVKGLGDFVSQVVADLLPEMEAEAREHDAHIERGGIATVLEQFVAERARGFDGEARKALVSRLVGYATHEPAETPGLVLAGASGLGKSALFARLSVELQATDVCLLVHAAGIDPQSSSVDAMLDGWIDRLGQEFGSTNRQPAPADTVTNKPAKAEQVFASLLTRVAAQRRVVLLVDALDRLERTPRGEHATWLPPLPSNVRFLATAIPGSETEALSRRTDVRTEVMQPLGQAEAATIAEGVYRRYHREPNRQAVAVLLEKRSGDGSKAHGNPLWLVGATEELNLLDGDDFRRAGSEYAGTEEERLHALVLGEAARLAADIEGLYADVFARLEGTHGAALVRAFLTVLAASRAGLRERDLRSLVPSVAAILDPTGSPLVWDSLAFAALRRSLRAHLLRRGADDRWDFHHAQARTAVARAYPNHRAPRIHAAIADHLLGLAPEDPMRESETMHHLACADDKERALRLYADRAATRAREGASRVLVELADTPEGLSWIAELPRVRGITLGQAYFLGERFLFDLSDGLARRGQTTAQLAIATAAAWLFDWLARCLPEQENAECLRYLHLALRNTGECEEHLGHLQRALRRYEEAAALISSVQARLHGFPVHGDLMYVFSRQAVVKRKMGRLEEALEASQKALEASRQGVQLSPTNPESRRRLCHALMGVGELYQALNRFDEARARYQKAADLGRELARENPSDVLTQGTIGEISHRIRRLPITQDGGSQDLPSPRETVEISRRLYRDDPSPWTLHGLALSLSHFAEEQLAVGQLDEAASAQHEALQILRSLERTQRARPMRVVSQDGPDLELHGKRTDWQRDQVVSLIRLGQIEHARGRVAAAAAFYQEALPLARWLCDQDSKRPQWIDDLYQTLSSLAEIELEAGYLERARQCFAEAIEMAERKASEAGTSIETQLELWARVSHVGHAFQERGHLRDALQAFRRAREILRRLADADPGRFGGVREQSMSANRVAQLELELSLVADALVTFEQGLATARRLLDRKPDDPVLAADVVASLAGTASAYTAQGNQSAAAAQYREALGILERLSGEEAPVESLDANLQLVREKLAMSLQALGDLEDERGNIDAALAVFREGVDCLRTILKTSETPDMLGRLGDLLARVGRDEVNLVNAARARVVPATAGEGYVRSRLEAARAAFAETKEIASRLASDDVRSSQYVLAVALGDLAAVENALGDRESADDHLRRAVQTLTALEVEGQLLPVGIAHAATLRKRLASMDASAHAPEQAKSGKPPAVDVPPPHHGTDANRAAELNIAYQHALSAWNALPMWKRLRTRKPEPPVGI